MIWLFVFALNDTMDNLISTNFEMSNSNVKDIFPSVSVCIQMDYRFSVTERIKEVLSEDIKEFVLEYYEEHNIDEPN